MIEKGRYLARAVEWRLGLTNTGNEQLGVSFKLEDGRFITWYGYFTEATAERTLESMEHMGWDGVDVTNPMGLDRNDVSLVVEHETGQDGKTYAKVRWVNRPSGGIAMKEELKGGALQSFKQRMQGAVLARRQKSSNAQGRPPAQRRQPEPRQSYHDEPPEGFYEDGGDPMADCPI